MLKRIRQFRAIQARRLSTASSPYDNYTKLRAFPFHIRPEKAQRMLASLAAMTCNMEKFWPSLGAYPLPFLNLDFLRPARFSAVYFPAWFVTGEVEARITYKGVELTERAWFDNTYFPGNHLAVLSAAPLSFPFLMETKTVPFTTSLLHQHGEPVQCIPFSTSPFSVLDIAASHRSSGSIEINKHLSIDPSSVKPNLVSAYPVLLPLYLAQYEIQGQKDSDNNMFTFFIKAHDDPLLPELDSIMCENLSKIDINARKVNDMRFIGNNESSGEVHTFSSGNPRVSMLYISTPHKKVITKYLNEWLEELLSSSKNIEILAESSLGVIGKGDEDLRMRELTSEEEASLENYASISVGVMELRRYLNTLTVVERNAIQQSDWFVPNFLKQRKKVEVKIKSLEAERARFAPEWWSEWLALNRPKSENTKSHGGDENVADGTRSPPKD